MEGIAWVRKKLELNFIGKGCVEGTGRGEKRRDILRESIQGGKKKRHRYESTMIQRELDAF